MSHWLVCTDTHILILVCHSFLDSFIHPFMPQYRFYCRNVLKRGRLSSRSRIFEYQQLGYLFEIAVTLLWLWFFSFLTTKTNTSSRFDKFALFAIQLRIILLTNVIKYKNSKQIIKKINQMYTQIIVNGRVTWMITILQALESPASPEIDIVTRIIAVSGAFRKP